MIVDGSQLCPSHYLQVCEPTKGKKYIPFENQNINKTFYEQNNIFTIKNLLDNLNNQNTMLIDVSLKMWNIDFLDNIIPATLDIYAILFHSGKFERISRNTI